MKTILRDKANFDILEGFLSALLEDDEIQVLNILESESNQNSDIDKYNRVDLLIEDKDKRKIYIEIQNTRETDYLQSLLYSTSKIIVDNQKLGEDFRNISKVISISIMYFNLGIGDDYIYHGTNEFVGLNTGTKLKVKKQQKLKDSIEPKYKFVETNIFPEYYLITVERYPNIIKKKIDEWIYMFKNNEIAEGSSSKNIAQARQKLSEINMDEQERRIYEKYIINTVRDRDALNTAKAEGLKEGEIKGKIEGLKEGEIKGKIEGLKEGEIKGKIEVAINALKSGLPVSIISSLTGLTEQEIEKLR
jgi:predicted transposase/invertase (TIGR01784 family)